MLELQERLEDAVRRHGVVGASIAMLDGAEIEVAAAGIADDRTGQPVTTATRFGIWSVTKPMTTMALLSLMREGLLELDDSVYDVVPELARPGGDDGLRIRHLLDSTNGLPGLFFPDTGDGPDALERVVPLLAAHRRIHPPGQRWAYSNLGFVVAGVITERLTGRVWDEVLRDRVLQPLGLSDTGRAPGDPAVAGAAVHHHVSPDGSVLNLGTWRPRCSGPAGGTVESTPSDLCRFGAALAGAEWAEMRKLQVPVGGPHMDGWALGMAHFGWGAGVVGWDGFGPGMRIFLRVVPGRGTVALMTSSSNGRSIYRSLVKELLADRCGVAMEPERPDPVDDPAVAREAIDRVVPGVYRCADNALEIRRDDGPVTVRSAFFGPDPVRLLPAGGTSFLLDQDFDYPVVDIDGDFASIACYGFRRDD